MLRPGRGHGVVMHFFIGAVLASAELSTGVKRRCDMTESAKSVHSQCVASSRSWMFRKLCLTDSMLCVASNVSVTRSRSEFSDAASSQFATHVIAKS